MDAARGCVALERGPLVYCLESTDQEAGISLAEVLADPADELEQRDAPAALGGCVVVRGAGTLLTGAPTPLTFIPYHAWGNRGLATMRVWVPEAR